MVVGLESLVPPAAEPGQQRCPDYPPEGPLGCGRRLIRKRHTVRHRLLEQDVLAGAGRIDGDIAVGVSRSHDADGIDLSVGGQLLVMRMRLGNAETPGDLLDALGAARAHLNKLDGGDVREHLRVHFAEEPETDDTILHRVTDPKNSQVSPDTSTASASSRLS